MVCHSAAGLGAACLGAACLGALNVELAGASRPEACLPPLLEGRAGAATCAAAAWARPLAQLTLPPQQAREAVHGAVPDWA